MADRPVEPNLRMPARLVPGEVLLHPLALISIAVLVVNDRGLKPQFGHIGYWGILTGKLSDMAGLICFPLAVMALFETARWYRRRGRAGSGAWSLTRRHTTLICSATGVAFSSIQVVEPAANLYETALTAVWWLAGGAFTALGAPAADIVQIEHVMDGSDICCLPALWVSHAIGSSTRPRSVADTWGGGKGSGKGSGRGSR